MIKEVLLNDRKIQYSLEYKKVKNINLRISPEGQVRVSASRRVPQRVIEEFIISKADFIIRAMKRCEIRATTPQTQYFSESEICRVTEELCKSVYPYYEKLGVKYPQIKFRSMVSRWGSCHPVKGVLTFNTKLMYAPPECVRYVVLHEFTHFLQANHSDKFYSELQKVCPDWRACRKKLREINVR